MFYNLFVFTTQTTRTHCYSLCLILFLLRSQSELNEQLLELLIAVVDAELLKTVGRNIRNMHAEVTCKSFVY